MENSTNLTSNKLPILLIFGGGSGSFFINSWVVENLTVLTKHFCVVHLTGLLQKNSDQKTENSSKFSPKNQPQNSVNSNSDTYAKTNSDSTKNPNYLPLPSLLEEMPMVLKLCDLVICRAGISSIGELLYLNKPGFLVPIPDSHQEINAQVVAEFFPTLEQKDSQNWLESILNYQEIFAKIKYPKSIEIEQKLENYYQKVYDLISKNS